MAHAIGRMRPGSVIAVIADAAGVLDQFRHALTTAGADDAGP